MPAERVLRGIARADLQQRVPGPSRASVDHLVSDFGSAIERNELTLRFQPIIELRTGRCYRAEGLASWVHPTAGAIGPRDIVRLAELSGTTLSLAMWSVREAIRLRAAWQKDDLELGLSLNLAGADLAGDGAARVLDVIRTARARPAAFTFEVPAATFARDPSALAGLRTLASAGARIALDDVSEANVPHRTQFLELDEQKIARSVVLRASSDAVAALALRRLLALGKDLGLVSVAVGVEDEATYRMLLAFDCDLAQGYWMSRPLATADVARWHAKLARTVLAGTTAIAAFSGLAKFASAALSGPVRDPLAGPSAQISAVATMPGTTSSCCALRAPGGGVDIGVSMRTVMVYGATVHMEGTLSEADAARVVDAVARDIGATERAFNVTFESAPDVYVFSSRGSFALGLQRGFGQRATDASALAAGNGGVAFSDKAAVAINWENVRSDQSLSIVRHELTHLLTHQMVGPSVDVPAWFDEGLSTLMERTVVSDAHRDIVADAATLTLLRRGEASLQGLSSSGDWTLRNAQLGGGGYTLAAAGMGVLRDSIGMDGIAHLLQRAHQVGFGQAFGESTGESPADFSLSFPSRFGATHGGLHVAHTATADGVKWAVAGLVADAQAHVTIDGAGGYHLGFDVTADRQGGYSAVFGATAAPGDYTITVSGPTGSASTQVSVGSG